MEQVYYDSTSERHCAAILLAVERGFFPHRYIQTRFHKTGKCGSLLAGLSTDTHTLDTDTVHRDCRRSNSPSRAVPPEVCLISRKTVAVCCCLLCRCESVTRHRLEIGANYSVCRQHSQLLCYLVIAYYVATSPNALLHAYRFWAAEKLIGQPLVILRRGGCKISAVILEMIGQFGRIESASHRSHGRAGYHNDAECVPEDLFRIGNQV